MMEKYIISLFVNTKPQWNNWAKDIYFYPIKILDLLAKPVDDYYKESNYFQEYYASIHFSLQSFFFKLSSTKNKLRVS